ncbi:MAG TPA: sigma-70 family RNA polymerase sigma factor, partial [Thermoanaerobaculia bacterium]|nr:sigma-70 family RNA polymerase sigma factor [Thermoanaerobaculia bacterium]
MQAALPHLVEDLFRHRYGALVARLCRVLGAERLELAEDVVQEALLSALRNWPADGVPEQPEAWVFRVARNRALDALRRSKVAGRVERELQAFAQEAAPDGPAPDVVADDTLRMMFTCCHPAVPPDSRVPLVLKTVAGFGVPEIAGALLQKDGTIGQRLSRAKAKLQQEQVRFEVPPPQELPARLPPVLDALYLMFNEGWRSHRGKGLLRPDLVQEAVRLCGLLLENAPTRRPEVHALLALMLLLGARLPARTDALGDLLTLAEQDRSRWDREWLQCG